MCSSSSLKGSRNEEVNPDRDLPMHWHSGCLIHTRLMLAVFYSCCDSVDMPDTPQENQLGKAGFMVHDMTQSAGGPGLLHTTKRKFDSIISGRLT